MLTAQRIIEQKKRLARSLRGLARQLENPAYLPFLTKERRKCRIFVLKARAEREQRDAERMTRFRKHGAEKPSEF